VILWLTGVRGKAAKKSVKAVKTVIFILMMEKTVKMSARLSRPSILTYLYSGRKTGNINYLRKMSFIHAFTLIFSLKRRMVGGWRLGLSSKSAAI
jgi:hypothetical protein